MGAVKSTMVFINFFSWVNAPGALRHPRRGLPDADGQTFNFELSTFDCYPFELLSPVRNEPNAPGALRHPRRGLGLMPMVKLSTLNFQLSTVIPRRSAPPPEGV